MRRFALTLSVLTCGAAGCGGSGPGDTAPRAGTGSQAPAKPEPSRAPTPESDPTAPAHRGPQTHDPLPGETHFLGLTQLTFGGENAEAYLSHDETKLVFQATREGMSCDRIFTMGLDGNGLSPVSDGRGRTTCAYWLPGDARILYASTHLAADDCLPPPDRSHGYVWKLYDEFDIFTVAPDGSDAQALVVSPGYDAEATVSPKGDRIVFTSTRDGDPELYSMNIDGSDLVRLTNAKGYDGGAFFSPDGRRIVYRANHPEGAEELGKYEEIIGQGLVRPTRLEIFVMDANGGNQTEITKNGKANFAPFFHPDGTRIIFASNMEDPKGRDFDLYLIGTDGEHLERVTHNDTFDGFPMFDRAGRRLVFASNRHHENPGDTNIFVADWED